GVRMEIRPPRPVTAAEPQVLPMFEGWIQLAELVVRASGVCEGPFTAALAGQGDAPPLSAPLAATITRADDAARPGFSSELSIPLRALAAPAGTPIVLALLLAPGAAVPGKDARRLALTKLTMVGLNGHGPHIAQLDLLESTDSVLFDAPERRLFD